MEYKERGSESWLIACFGWGEMRLAIWLDICCDFKSDILSEVHDELYRMASSYSKVLGWLQELPTYSPNEDDGPTGHTFASCSYYIQGPVDLSVRTW